MHELFTLYKIKHAGTQVIANKSSNIGKTTTTNQYRRVPDLWRPGSVKIKRYYAMHSFSFSPRRRFVFQIEISGKYSLLVLNSLLYFLFLSSPWGSVYRFLYTSYTPSTRRLRNLKAQLYLYGLAYRPHGTFRKRSSNWRNLRTATRFRVEGKHFETEAFQERRLHDNHVISLPELSSNKSKMAGDCWVLKLVRRSVDRTHLMRF